jgi:hypothetical protein
MDAEHEGGIQRSEQESSSWEYCVLTWQTEEYIMDYEVNERYKVKVAGRGEIQEEIRKEKRKPEKDPLGSYYQEKFIERWRETGGFGPSDAIDVLAMDGWEIATSFVSYEYNEPHIIFKRPRGPESSAQAA